MSEQIMINAVPRSEIGSNRARNIRNENMVPAVIYGNEKELLKEWIAQKAPYRKHWSFVPVKKVKTPLIENEWAANDIDKFILKKMLKTKLTPNPVNFDHRLFRRISFLLNGLPPDDSSFEKFRAGKLTYSEYVDQLLNSSSYGEHMAVMWLDSARYGDTNGMQYDNSRPIWPYRDWVIKAFNANMPYDQFLTEQVAGDLLPNSDISQKVATGFLRCNVTTNEMGAIEEEFKARNAKDRVNTTMLAFTGLTFNCAECHDHKYDPISQKEYYELLAYFNNIDGLAVGFPYERADAPIIPVLGKDENKVYQALNDQSEKQLKQMAKLKENSADAFWWWHYQTMASPPKVIFLMGQLESFFPFDEKEGTVTYNLINEEACNVKGIPFRNKGKFGNSLRFNSRAYVISQTAGRFKKNDEISLGFWINPEEENKGTVLGRFDSIKQKGWKLAIDDGRISFHMKGSEKDGMEITSQSQVELDKWSHVALTYDGKEKAAGIRIYINGKPVKTETVSDNLSGSIGLKGDMLIGIENQVGWLVYCSVDEVFTAKKLLTQKEINDISQFKSASRLALIPPDQLTPKFKKELLDYYLKFHHKEYSSVYSEYLKVTEQIQEIISRSDTTMVMKEKEEPEETFILDRGDYERKGEKVSRKLPAFLNPNKKTYLSSRLGLAQWLLDKEHPLTSRVIVNRIWQHFLGYGLVRTPEDFGNQGEYPTHPELLDHLANFLVENNWDLKKLIRYIVSSSTFKQSSELNKIKKISDPENIHYSYFKRSRLPAESIRDQALFLSGLLVEKVGGPPVFPYQPPGLWKEVTFDISNTKKYEQSVGEGNYRKTIYSFWKRNLPPPSMTIFDAPYRQNCSLNRNSSNTPLQALVLLNDPQFIETYNKLSNNLKFSEKDDTSYVENLFLKLYRRLPSRNELNYSLLLLKTEKNHLLIHSLMNTDEFISID